MRLIAAVGSTLALGWCGLLLIGCIALVAVLTGCVELDAPPDVEWE